MTCNILLTVVACAQERQMSEQSADELRGLLAGTWIGIACLAELLAERGILPRSELTSLLASSEARAEDQHRRSGIAGLRRLIESGFGARPAVLGRGAVERGHHQPDF